MPRVPSESPVWTANRGRWAASKWPSDRPRSITSSFWIQILFNALLNLPGALESIKNFRNVFWSSRLAQLHQARSIERRKVFESQTITYSARVCVQIAGHYCPCLESQTPAANAHFHWPVKCITQHFCYTNEQQNHFMVFQREPCSSFTY